MIPSRYLVLNEILKAGDDYISGQEIAEGLGISRSAVNKAVSVLRDEGYIIEAVNRKGYQISSDPDQINYGELLSYLPSERLKTIAVYETVSSTNVSLHELAENGAGTGQTVIADAQTMGRSRGGGSFASPDNKSIYMSYLIVPSGKIDIKKITPLAADTLAGIITKMSDNKIEVKYPGDLYIDSRKVSGILSEILMEAESGYIRYIMLGIGIRPIKGIKRAAVTASLIRELDNLYL
ncbi:biotin--[acetyl-CoA-carboxylase] ligase [Lachnospiraceae bacterium C1.1]|nr:biotin--[acetyl-CoA-carboxylase] ligase [Lachnospiraceae bacterium C1.1]